MSTRTLPPRAPSPPANDFSPPPRRPRRRLVTPVTGVLAAVLVLALGFLGGVEVQKHSGSSSSAAAGGPPSLAGGQGGGSAGGGPPGMTGAPTGSGTQGTVSYVKHGVIYVKDGDGATIKVKVADGTDVTRTASTGAARVHPGDSVTVQGKASGATVTATSVTATASDG